MPDAPAARQNDRWVALFRAVNVGGRGQVPMADLRAMATRIGLAETRTILQTGNLVFAAPPGKAAALEAALEAAAAGIGLASDIMVRSAADWTALVAGNPFEAAARDNPAHLVLLILKDDPAAGAQAALETAIKGREQIRVAGRSAYVVFPDGIGRSKLTPQVLERRLGTRATGRNWNTVEKIAAALAA